jgi:hypothetical protein
MAAAIVQAVRDQVMHALLSHIGEVHRRPGFVAGFGHQMLVGMAGGRNAFCRRPSPQGPPTAAQEGAWCSRTFLALAFKVGGLSLQNCNRLSEKFKAVFGLSGITAEFIQLLNEDVLPLYNLQPLDHLLAYQLNYFLDIVGHHAASQGQFSASSPLANISIPAIIFGVLVGAKSAGSSVSLQV